MDSYDIFGYILQNVFIVTDASLFFLQMHWSKPKRISLYIAYFVGFTVLDSL